MNFRRLKRAADKAYTDYRHAKRSVADEEKALRSYNEAVDAAVKAQAIIQRLAAEVQTTAHKQITKVVTKSLRFVFQKKYKFQIEFARKRGKTEARLHYTLNKNRIDPLSEDGGGLLDVSAFALRVSCLLLGTPKQRRALWLDEPFRNVNGTNYRLRTANLVESLSQTWSIQIFMATGMDWLKIGKVNEL